MMVSPTETFRRVQPYGDQGPERCWLRKQLLGLSTSLAKCQMAASGKKPPQKKCASSNLPGNQILSPDP